MHPDDEVVVASFRRTGIAGPTRRLTDADNGDREDPAHHHHLAALCNAFFVLKVVVNFVLNFLSC